MRIFILGFVFIFSSLYAFGHNPLSARYHLKAGEQASLLTINLSQDGVNHLFLKKYGAEKFAIIHQNEFKEWIVDYIKSNFNLSIDNKEIVLKKGGIKLGSHQTDLKFILPPLPQKIQNIQLHLPAFKENVDHQTIFSYTIYGKKDKVILSASNNFQAEIQVVSPNTTNQWIGMLGGLMMLVSSFLFFKRKWF